MQKYDIPGLAIATLDGGAVVDRYYGVTQAGKKEGIDRNTIFEVASLSKPPFAYGVLRLVERGFLDLDKPLLDYLNECEIQDERANLITARMVLAHTSGLPNWRPKGESLKIYFNPGDRFSYSGEGFLLLQKVVEAITALSIEDYLQAHVLQPLGMLNSSYVWQPPYEVCKAYGHSDKGFSIKREKPLSPNAAYTLHATLLDYANFIRATLNDEGLSSQKFQEMLTSQIFVGADRVNSIDKPSNALSKTISWGLGWGLQKSSYGNCFWHWGDNGGYKCYVAGFKAQKKALIVLTNSANGLTAMPDIIQDIWHDSHPAFDWLSFDD